MGIHSKHILRCNGISHSELSYVAGFLDADGCVNAQIVPRQDYMLKYQIRVSITFYQKSQRYWILQYLHKLLGIGSLRQRKDGMSEYSITNTKDVYAMCQLMMKHVKVKKPQCTLLSQILQQRIKKNDVHQFLQKCRLVDRFAALNDSKKRKIYTETVEKTLCSLGLYAIPVETINRTR